MAVGDQGEAAAARYLEKKGYRILARKYRTRIGEIDIIAAHNAAIVFIEVKTRKNNRYGTPASAVTYHKQRKLIKTALYYLLATRSEQAAIRFDVLEVMLSDTDIRYNHIENAFGG